MELTTKNHRVTYGMLILGNDFRSFIINSQIIFILLLNEAGENGKLYPVFSTSYFRVLTKMNPAISSLTRR